MACAVVCVSYATGAGGDEVARDVARQLGFLHVDEEIVARAAAAGGLTSRDVADEEQRKSLASRILDALAVSGGDAVALGGAVPFRGTQPPDSADVRALIRETIVQTAGRGRVVISAHAASHALDQRTDILRVLVTGSPSGRAKRIREKDGTDEAGARRAIRRADAARRDYLKRFYEIDRELPTHYDLVINTDVLSVEDAARIVVDAASR